MGLLQDKKFLIVGVASNRSIAAGIGHAFAREGAKLAYTYQNEKLQSRVEAIANETGASICLPCDVTLDDDIKNLFSEISKSWGKFDGLIHSVAFAPQELLGGDYLESINRQGFLLAHEISSYSFAALAQSALPYLSQSASLLTMTYLGAERTVPAYNVMGIAKASLEANMRYMAQSLGPKGIRVNAISAGPIKTLAASGIKGLKKMLHFNEQSSPLRKNITTEDVGNTAAFLASHWAQGITGEVLHVDAGMHSVAIPETINE